MIVLLFLFLFNNSELVISYNKGIKNYKKGNYKIAIDLFNIERNNKKRFKHYFYLGHSYSLLGDNKNALKMYDLALSTKFKKSVIYFETGLSYFLIDESEKALQNLNLALKNDPNNPSYLINRGTIKYDLGLKKSACSDWNRAMSLDINSINKELIMINCN
jgi:tetratricopeptide (TPR) repeat protein